ncbi:MAG TPA: pitrilysin family protein [Fibrobacteria bacterium]|nr:pitrilysin family protein [Fibrobacteria bacterium]
MRKVGGGYFRPPGNFGRCGSFAFLLSLFAFFSSASADIHAAYRVLPNGLKVILYPSRQAPTVSCRLFYVTGSVHEHAGNTGIAHLLEHMLFKGTHKVGVKDSVADGRLEARLEVLQDSLERLSGDSEKARALRAAYDSLITEQRKGIVPYELWETYEKAGGTGLNAFTSDLMTAYIVTLPRNRVELFLWLEADRMQNAVLREFLPERDVVMEERRMRVDDPPVGRYWESLQGVFYEAHPYRLPTIGYPSDIKHLTRRQADEHYRRYYKPNNAILVLAGDLDTTATLANVERYFGSIPRGDDFPPVVTAEPEPAGEKRLIVRRADASPRIDMLFHTPGFPHPDLAALSVLEGVLSGRSGRLHKKLVTDLRLATSASAGSGVDKYSSSFQIVVGLDGNPDIAKVEAAVWEVLGDLARNPVSERELQRARNQVAATTERSKEDMEELATELAYWEMRGGWDNINSFPNAVQAVTAWQVREAAARYFRRDAVTVGVMVPPDEAANAKNNEKTSAAKKTPRKAKTGATP